MSSEKTGMERELESEIRSFEEDRERIRKIVGNIGGKPSRRTRVINIIFVILVISVFALSIMWGGRMRFFMIEVGILLLSLKFVYFLEAHTRLNHFQFWILSSLEWRLDKIDKTLKRIMTENEPPAEGGADA
ncbi:MAG: hypothetical protein GF392_05230 [Candidatus Omnitrophica bacterium]|nr:hypothetical protein [Candidatus Omnitrophota bacterium]